MIGLKMNTVLTSKEVKEKASVLRDYLAGIDRKITRGNALEAVSKIHGYKSWNVLSSTFSTLKTSQEPMNSGSNTTISIAPVLTPIAAVVKSDDGNATGEFDAFPWFQQASDEEILKLSSEEWCNSYEADEVALYIEASRQNEQVNTVFDYIANWHTYHQGRKDALGFEVEVDELEALRYCRVYRYALFVELMLIKYLGEEKANLEVVANQESVPPTWKVLRSTFASEFNSRQEAYEMLGCLLEGEFPQWLSPHERSIFEFKPYSLALSGHEKVKGRYDPKTKTGDVMFLPYGATRPSHEQLRSITADGKHYVEMVVPIYLSDMISGDIESINDNVSAQITGNSGDLTDISLSVCTDKSGLKAAFPEKSFDEIHLVYLTVVAGWDPINGINED